MEEGRGVKGVAGEPAASPIGSLRLRRPHKSTLTDEVGGLVVPPRLSCFSLPHFFFFILWSSLRFFSLRSADFHFCHHFSLAVALFT